VKNRGQMMKDIAGSRALVLAATVAAVCACVSCPALAGTKLYSPLVEEGALEIEQRGFVTSDSKSSLDDEQFYSASIGYGLTDYWFAEIGGEWVRDPGTGKTRFDATKWENRLEIIGDGSHFVDFGLLIEYLKGGSGQPDKFEFGPLIEKRIGNTVTRANLLFEREIGAGRDSGLGVEYGAGIHYEFSDEFYAGIEAFGSLGPVHDFKSSKDQEHRAGPVLGGAFELEGVPGEIKAEIGYLRGLTGATADDTVKWMLEYELEF